MSKSANVSYKYLGGDALTRYVFHDEIKSMWILKGEEEFDHPITVRLGQNISLCLYVSQLTPSHNIAFLQNFHRI